MKITFLALSVVAATLFSLPYQYPLSASGAGAPGKIVWAKQLKSAEAGLPAVIRARPGGDVYLAGSTPANSQGYHRGFIAKFSAQGKLLWDKLLGKQGDDTQVTWADLNRGGDVLVVGQTSGNLYRKNAGGYDVFCARVSGKGQVVWGRQIGSKGHDFACSIACRPNGSFIIIGNTEGDLYDKNHNSDEPFISLFSADGTLIWGRQYAQGCIASRAAQRSDGTLVIASCDDNIGDPDGAQARTILTCYDVLGRQRWSKRLHVPPLDCPLAICCDRRGNIYVGGYAQAGTYFGERLTSGYLIRCDAAGDQQWLRMWQTPQDTAVNGIAIDGAGCVMAVGYQLLPGKKETGDYPYPSKAVVERYTPQGARLSSSSFGTAQGTMTDAVAAAPGRDTYVAGETIGVLFVQGQSGGRTKSTNGVGTSPERYAGFVAKLRP